MGDGRWQKDPLSGAAVHRNPDDVDQWGTRPPASKSGYASIIRISTPRPPHDLNDFLNDSARNIQTKLCDRVENSLKAFRKPGLLEGRCGKSVIMVGISSSSRVNNKPQL
ncbi:hypothetical protein [Flexibacterium corallicola]|uniref:hypothetical protein n=1 Tax=Flexibacterium corallicola TaxID=3037259 RepID=UPI00286EF651|nr:hypothetical protein [Pseudovibrio sp. M1P-2-3]